MYPESLPYVDPALAEVKLEADALYHAEGLEAPSLPSCVPPLRRLAVRSFGTSALPEGATLYNVNTLLYSILRGHVRPPFAAHGFAGYGLMSQAIHLHVVTPQAVVLLQMRWGTIQDDRKTLRGRYEEAAAGCRQLADESRIAMVRSSIPEDERMIVVQSDFAGKYWSRLPAAPLSDNEIAAIEWHPGDDAPIQAALAEVRSAMGHPVVRPAST
ncbi:hypothetical protein DB346_10195 [Verrucomicrobia bacterium LW23]|nr:hypothetical protein DB346_10195 [Verrucomicrobia bacterium LW23]